LNGKFLFDERKTTDAITKNAAVCFELVLLFGLWVSFRLRLGSLQKGWKSRIALVAVPDIDFDARVL